MRHSKTPSFIATMKLNTSRKDDEVLDARFFVAFLIKNRLIKHASSAIRSCRQDERTNQLMAERKAAGDDKKARNDVNQKLADLRLERGLSEFAFQAWIKEQQHKYSRYIDANTAQKIATQVWQSCESVLFGKGRNVRFLRLEDLYSLEGKNNASGIRFKDGRLEWLGLEIQPQKDNHDAYLAEALTHRVKFCRIVRMAVGGRWHYYLQLVLEGLPPKKHEFLGSGRVGIDPGVSVEAVVSDKGCILQEIMPISRNNDRIVSLQQKLDRSRRATNPSNYNADGTVKRGPKAWYKSKTYRHTQMQLKSIRRRNAASLRQQENILANDILCNHGTDIFTEKMDYAALAKKAKTSHVDEKTGRNMSCKRFGATIAGHAPSRFLAILARKLSYVGKVLNYVDTWKFKASQYDHVLGDFVKHELSDRRKEIGGMPVQRDLYSAFLLMHAATPEEVDRQGCMDDFVSFIKHMSKCVDTMKAAGMSKPSVFGF